MHEFHPSILREYDIRGQIGQTLSDKDAFEIGRCFGASVREAFANQSQWAVAVGYDGRVSSPDLEAALVNGLNAVGVDAVRIGLGPTPMLYFAERLLEEVQGGIEITGSHNPPDYNGFKMTLDGKPFFGQSIAAMGARLDAGNFPTGAGTSRKMDIMDDYIARLLQDFDGEPLKIGWDAGNGAAGEVIEKLTQKLPGEHHLLYTEIDGHFPNHHPDPTEDHNLQDLIALVAEKKLDFGVAFDGDGDRIGAVDGQGRVIRGDQLLMIYSEMVLKAVPGATIIGDVKVSESFFNHIRAHGGEAVMWKTGHSLIKDKMKETDAALGGEMSGHIFFQHGYYGFDDAIYAALQLARAPKVLGRSVTELRDAMPHTYNTPEVRIEVDETQKWALMETICANTQAQYDNVSLIDGVRAKQGDGWWLLRASNTQNMLVTRAEAESEAGLKTMIASIEEQLAKTGIKSDALAAYR